MADFVEEKDGVEIRLRKLDLRKTSQMFDAKFSSFDSMHPLLLTIKNKSGDKLLIKNKYIGLDLFTAQQITQKLSYNSGWPIAAGIAAIPLVVVGSFLVGWGILIATVPVGCASGLMLLPFLGLGVGVGIPVVVGIATSKAATVRHYNQALSRDLKRKVLDGTSIKPFKKETMLLFASRLPKNFEISVMNVSREEKIKFNVNFTSKKNHE